MKKLPSFIDLKGEKFGRLVVVGLNKEKNELEKQRKERGEIKKCNTYWDCVCECGNDCIVARTELRSGDTKSCGCIRKETIGKLGRDIIKYNEYEELKTCYKGWDVKKKNCFYISKEDYECVKQYCWCKSAKGHWYAHIKGEDKKRIGLHQLIMRLINSEYTRSIYSIPDHLDRNPNNNMRENIFLKDRSGNARNTKRPSNNTSGKKGVYFDKNSGLWIARICNNEHKRIHKSFNSLEDAVKQRLEWEKEFGYIGE